MDLLGHYLAGPSAVTRKQINAMVLSELWHLRVAANKKADPQGVSLIYFIWSSKDDLL
jgi:hypothetical protein